LALSADVNTARSFDTNYTITDCAGAIIYAFLAARGNSSSYAQIGIRIEITDVANAYSIATLLQLPTSNAYVTQGVTWFVPSGATYKITVVNSANISAINSKFISEMKLK
jgi:hypothetical protein